MKVLYILNESDFYMRLAWHSLRSLRHFTPDIPVEILMIRDGGRDNRDIANWGDLDLGVPRFTQDQFADEASTRFNCDLNFVDDYDPADEAGYTPAQRSEFARVQGEDVLFLDADTFILDDIWPLFDRLSECQLLADKNDWGRHGRKMPIEGVQAFNSGVVMFGGGLVRDYGAKVRGIMRGMVDNTHPLGEWLGQMEFLWTGGLSSGLDRPKKLGREELAFCAWVQESNIDYRFFHDREVQTNGYNDCQTRILHTLTPNWHKFWLRFFRNGRFLAPKRIKKVFMAR